MPVHSRDGQLYIVDTEAVWKEHMREMRREHRSRLVAWSATFLLGAIFWAAVLYAVLG